MLDMGGLFDLFTGMLQGSIGYAYTVLVLLLPRVAHEYLVLQPFSQSYTALLPTSAGTVRSVFAQQDHVPFIQTDFTLS